jgi:hypothetical protein
MMVMYMWQGCGNLGAKKYQMPVVHIFLANIRQRVAFTQENP